MRAFAFVALVFFAPPLIYFFIQVNHKLDQAREEPKPAAIVFTPRAGRQWLEEDQGRCIRAVLRGAGRRQRPRGQPGCFRDQ